MKGIIAKKYVNAIGSTFAKDELIKLQKLMGEIVSALNSQKFVGVISHPSIDKNAKFDFLVNTFSIKDKKELNLIKLLVFKNRLSITPQIYQEISNRLSVGEYKGTIYSSQHINMQEVSLIEGRLSQKLGSTIKLSFQKSDIDGIKIAIDNLDVEVVYSNDIFRHGLINYVLKAI